MLLPHNIAHAVSWPYTGKTKRESGGNLDFEPTEGFVPSELVWTSEMNDVMVGPSHIKQHDLLYEVAERYYVQDWTQAQLARHTGLSQSQISRLVKEARRSGVVEIRVHHPYRVNAPLQEELKQRLGLDNCRVLASSSTAPINEGQGRDEDIPGRVGVLAAQYLQEHIADHSVIGMGWGSMVQHTVTSGYLAGKRGMTVTQIQGGVGGATQDVDGARLVHALGQQLRANTYYLNAPMVVADPAVRSGLMRDPHIRQTIDVGKRADTLIMGVGAVTQLSGLYRAGYLSDSELGYIADEGAVGDICGRYYRQDGSACSLELDERVVALSRDDILQAPLRVGISAGIEKALPNIGAANSGLINVLITDEYAAAEMLHLMRITDGESETTTT